MGMEKVDAAGFFTDEYLEYLRFMSKCLGSMPHGIVIDLLDEINQLKQLVYSLRE